MDNKYECDNLDLAILHELQHNGRVSYLDLAKKLLVSGRTIHVRVDRLREYGILQGFTALVDYEKLGYKLTVFIGINLSHAHGHNEVITALRAMPEVLEAHYTTGTYSLLIKVMAKDPRDLHHFLVDKIQVIPSVQSTETLISLDTSIARGLDLRPASGQIR